VLERLISKKLQLAAAARSGIKVSDEMVAKAVASLAQGNKLSLAQLREVLAKDGVDFRDFQEDLRAQLTIKQLVETEVVRRIQVSDQEVEGYLARFGGGAAEGRKEYRLSHILIATKEAADPALHEQARDKAERLVQELRGAPISAPWPSPTPPGSRPWRGATSAGAMPSRSPPCSPRRWRRCSRGRSPAPSRAPAATTSSAWRRCAAAGSAN
jgi:hypothetical protein